MKINFKFKNCILCLKNEADSFEHIIPKNIGGRLQAFLLCTKCNNSMGSELISKVKIDPSIRIALHTLKYEIPHLFNKIEKNQVYYGENINKDKVKFTLKKSKPHITEGIQEDGSLIIDTKKIPDYLLKKLKKQGLCNEEIKEKIKLVDESENNEILELSQTEKLVKRTIDSIKPSLAGPLMDERIVALIAYEYLGLLIGNNIVKDNFDFIRDFLINEIVSDNIFIERLSTRKYSPYHKLFPEFLDSEIIINLTLFGWLFFKVHFTIKSNIKEFPDVVYLEDLKNKISYIAKSVLDARQNKYYALTQRIIK